MVTFLKNKYKAWKKKHDFRAVLFTIIALIIFFFSASRVFLQYQHLADYQIRKEANDFLKEETNRYFHTCGETLYAKQKGKRKESYTFSNRLRTVNYQVFVATKDFEFHAEVLEISEEDRENGIDAKVKAKYEALGKYVFNKTSNISNKANLQIAQEQYSFNTWFVPGGDFSMEKNYFFAIRKQDKWVIVNHQFKQLGLMPVDDFSCEDIPSI